MPRSIPLLLLILPGCTAVKAGYALVDAQVAYQQALDEGAEERSVYQITLAHEYLQKAREEDGYSDYGAADQLAGKAKVASRKAQEEAREGGVPPDETEELPDAPSKGEEP